MVKTADHHSHDRSKHMSYLFRCLPTETKTYVMETYMGNYEVLETIQVTTDSGFTENQILCKLNIIPCHYFSYHIITFVNISMVWNAWSTFHEELPQRRQYTKYELITISTTIGFGAFVDKTVLPYTNTNEKKLQRPCDEADQQCQAAFGYRHVLSMTNSELEFKRKVTEQSISGNLDSPEGSLDAMMQAAVCGVRT